MSNATLRFEEVRLADRMSCTPAVEVETRAETETAAPTGYPKALWWILGVGLVVRLALFAASWHQPLGIWDERDYHTLAMSLVERSEFGYYPGKPASLRPPLYPTLVAGIYAVSGGENPRAVRLVQLLLSLGTVVVLYHLGTATHSQRVGVWLAGLACFYPSLLGYNNLILTETLFTFLLCATCLALVRALQSSSYKLLVLGGCLLGLATLTRSVLWLFPPVLGLFLLCTWRGPAWQRCLAAVLPILAFALTIAPWAVRNMRLEKTFVTIDTMGGRNVMMGNYEHTPEYRAWDAISNTGEQAWYNVLATKHPNFGDLTQGQRDKLALKEGIGYALANPGTTARRDVIKFFQFWGLERELIAGANEGIFGSLSKPQLLLVAAVILGSYVLVFSAGIFGIFLAPPRDWRVLALLLLFVFFITALHTVAFGHSRYHLPLMPLVMLFAAGLIVGWRASWARRRSLAFVTAAVITCIFTVGWLWEIVIVETAKWQGMLANLT